MKISVIIPVINESETINSLLDSLDDCEIIVTDCIGNTLEAISRTDVKGIKTEKGRAVQMNRGAEAASGDVLFFLHADSVPPKNWQAEIADIMEYCCAGAFSLAIDSPKPIFRLIEKISTLRSRLTRIPYGDMGIFIKKDLFLKAGGYEEIPIFEDFRLMQRLKQTGCRIGISKSYIKTSARRWQRDGVIYTTLRNWLITLLYLCGVSPHSLKKMYK